MVIAPIDRRGQHIAAILAALVLMSASAVAQQASQAQQNAIREACPADYRANCANVPAAIWRGCRQPASARSVR
jgi:hypothetical protein